MRWHADPEPDDIAQEIYQQGGVEGLLEMKKFTDHWEAPISDALPPRVKEWFERPIVFPEWFDPKLIKVVEDTFLTDGPIATITLLMTGPPHFFTNPAGARCFWLAKIFSENSVKNRTREVPQFVVNICEKDGMTQTILPDGRAKKGSGVLTVQKLRFAHACIRIRLKMKQRFPEDDWDSSMFGEPINQEDLAQSVMDFCLATIEGLDKLGIHWTEQEKDASFHFWKTVGFLLGLVEELQPKDRAEGRLLQQVITARHARTSPDGVGITGEMLKVMSSMMPRFSKFMPAVLMRYIAGDEVARILQIPRHPIASTMLVLLKPFWRDTQLFAFIARRMVPKFIAWAMNNRFRETRGAFRLPESMGESWGVKK
jgi:hypothetical protein